MAKGVESRGQTAATVNAATVTAPVRDVTVTPAVDDADADQPDQGPVDGTGASINYRNSGTYRNVNNYRWVAADDIADVLDQLLSGNVVGNTVLVPVVADTGDANPSTTLAGTVNRVLAATRTFDGLDVTLVAATDGSLLVAVTLNATGATSPTSTATSDADTHDSE